jgi:hypothetical protein
MNPILAWSITIALCLAILAIPLRIINVLLLMLIAGPLTLVTILATL